MKTVRIALSALAISLLAANAHALQIDDQTNVNADGSAKLADPDDKVPYPHFDDNGQLQSTQTVNLSGGGNQPTFSSAPAVQSSDAFNRAVDNQK